MWVESELNKGSRFFFTITSQISHSSMESILAKMTPFTKRSILYVDSLYDQTGVVESILELGLKVHRVHLTSEVANKDTCPHFDTIVVDSLPMVRAILATRLFFVLIRLLLG